MWTFNARGILPADLVMYRKDHDLHAHNTFPHHTLYVKALEVITLGDNNAESYDILVQGLDKLGSTHICYADVKDDKCILDMKDVVDQTNATTTHQPSSNHEFTLAT